MYIMENATIEKSHNQEQRHYSPYNPVCPIAANYVTFTSMQKILCLLAALVLFCPASARATETISEVVTDTRDYMIEGDIVTIWDEGFLFDDGTGQIVVDTRPNNPLQAGLQGRMTVMVLGRLYAPEDTFKPKFIVLSSGEQISFTGSDAMPPMDMTKVMVNTTRYSKPRKVAGNSGMPAGLSSSGGGSGSSQTTATAAEQPSGPVAGEPGSGTAGSTSSESGEPGTAGTPLDANSPIMQKAKEAAKQAIAKAKAGAPDGAPTERPPTP
jgi:hypothetical protein